MGSTKFPQTRAAFGVGDKVRLKCPAPLSNNGRGYYNEGQPKYWEESKEAAEKLPKYVEGGSLGQVVGVFQVSDWQNRPMGHKGGYVWKGIRRPMIMVCFDDAS